MGPKKSDKKPSKGADGEVQGEDPLQFLQNYQRFSKLIGIPPNPKVVSQLQSDENQPLAQASSSSSSVIASQVPFCRGPAFSRHGETSVDYYRCTTIYLVWLLRVRVLIPLLPRRNMSDPIGRRSSSFLSCFRLNVFKVNRAQQQYSMIPSVCSIVTPNESATITHAARIIGNMRHNARASP